MRLASLKKSGKFRVPGVFSRDENSRRQKSDYLKTKTMKKRGFWRV
jgi:hypothetical protein